MALEAGEIVGRRFRIEAVLGRGGMGVVYQASDLTLSGAVALKTILPSRAADPVALQRFRAEVQAARQLNHPNLCRIFDIGEDAERGLVFFTMELVDGPTLSRCVRQAGRLEVPAALEILEQVAAGVDALHARGMVHRDLKPGNVLLARRGEGWRAVVSDFGLSRALEPAAGETATLTGRVAGTPEYFAPEQLLGAPPSAATDRYALGLIAFEILTGVRPFASAAETERLSALAPSPRSKLPTLPEQVDAAVRRMLAREPGERYATGAAFVAALRGGEPPLPDESVGDGALRDQALRGRAIRAVAASVLVLAAGAAVWFWSPARQGAPRPRGAALEARYQRATEQLLHSYRQSNLDEATGTLREIVAADPRFAMAHASLCRALYLEPTGEKDAVAKARESCHAALSIDPDLAPPHVILGLAYLDEGKTDLAAQEIQQALRLDQRNASAHAASARLYQAQGRKDEAGNALRRAVDLAPDDWRWWNGKGLFDREMGRPREAAAAFREVVRLTPENRFGYNNLAAAEIDLANFTAARVALERAAQLRPDPAQYHNLGTVLQYEGKLTEAAAAFDKAIALAPESYSSWFELALSRDWTGDRGGAVTAFQRAIALAEAQRPQLPRDARLLAYLAAARAAVGEREPALRDIRQALALAPENGLVQRRAASVYRRLGLRTEAVARLRSAMALGYSREMAMRNRELSDLLDAASAVKRKP